MIPTFDSCLVCDFLRPEQNRKLIILGFFGICPNVDIVVQRIDQPIGLTFLVSGGPGSGVFRARFDVFDEMDQRPVASDAERPFNADPKTATVLATTLILTFGHTGPFSLRCHVDGEVRFKGLFKISQPPAGAA